MDQKSVEGKIERLFESGWLPKVSAFTFSPQELERIRKDQEKILRNKEVDLDRRKNFRFDVGDKRQYCGM